MIENNKKNGVQMNEKWVDGQGVYEWWLQK